MKICPHCSTENSDDAEFCSSCVARLHGGAIIAPPPPVGPEKEAAAPPALAAIIVPPDISDTKPGKGDKPKPPPQPPPEDTFNTDNQDDVLSRLEDFAGTRNFRIIILFGHSTSGKSMFLLRAKSRALELGYSEVVPAVYEDSITLTGTTGVHLHKFRAVNDKVLVFVDIEGEMIGVAVKGSFSQKTGADLTQIIARAHGFIFIAPTMETLYLDDAYKANVPEFIRQKKDVKEQTAQVIASFRHLRNIVAFLGSPAIRKLAPEQQVERIRAISSDDWDKEGKPVRKCGKPALLLLSKADQAEKLWASSPKREFYKDPWRELAQSPNRILIPLMARYFRRFKVDFLSAAHGHEQVIAGDINKNIDLMECGFCGVDEAINWIRDEIDRAHGLTGGLRPGGAPAIAARWLLDKKFRNAFSMRGKPG